MAAIAEFSPSTICNSQGDEYCPRTTHIVSPASSRTLKTFGAALSGAWIITNTNWILDSLKEKKWCHESEYGSVFFSFLF